MKTKLISFILLLTSFVAAQAQQQADIKRVAILETVDKLGNVPYLKKLMFRSNLTSAITNTAGYEGYDRVDLMQITGEQDFQRTGMVSDADIKKIGEFTGAQYVLIAEATIDGEDLFITAKIIDVETARVMRNSNQLMGISASEMQTGSQKVAADLLGVPEKMSSSTTKSISNKGDFVNLGLPSGTLWKSKNEDGKYTYGQAIITFSKHLPTKEQFEELINFCSLAWDDAGVYVIGPNGESIFLPTENAKGFYWSQTNAGSDFSGVYGAYDLTLYEGKTQINKRVQSSQQFVRLVK